MSSGQQFVLDDSSEDFRFSGAEWTVTHLMQFYGGTSRTPRTPVDPQAPQFGTLSLTFEGTSVSFFGMTPSPPASQNVLVSIDGNTPYETTIGDGTVHYGQWYQTPLLQEGRHNITIDRITGASLDYAVVSAGQQASLTGRKVVVDDRNPLVTYGGSWRQTDQTLLSPITPGGRPLGNSTHQSWTQGDTVTFKFSGTSLAVYGIFSWRNLGVLSATYTIDGSSLSESYIVTTSSPEYINNIGDASNFLYYAVDALSAGEHTLVIDITRCNNQTFALDYITYTPSSNTSSRISPSSPPHSPSSTPAVASKIPDPLTSSSSKSSHSSSRKLPIEGLLAAGVGGLVLVALLIFLVVFLRRRRAKRHYGRQRIGSDYYDASRPLMSEQKTGLRTLYLRGGSMDSQRTYKLHPSTSNTTPPHPTDAPAESPENSARTIESFFPRQIASPMDEPVIFEEPRVMLPVQPATTFSIANSVVTKGPPLIVPSSERRLTPVRRQPTIVTANLSSTASPQPMSALSSTQTTTSPLIKLDIEAPAPVRHSTSTNSTRHAIVSPAMTPDTTRRNRSASDSMLQLNRALMGPRTPVRRGYSDSPVHNNLLSVPPSTLSLQPQLARKPLLTPVPDIESLLGDSRRQSCVIPLSDQLDQALAELLSPGPDSADSEFMRRRLSESDIESPRPLSAHSPLSELQHRLTPSRRPSDQQDPPTSSGQITAAFASPTRSPMSPIRARWASILNRASRPLPSGIPADVNGSMEEDDIFSDELEGPPAYHTLSARQSGSSQPMRSPRVALESARR
ncbi:hypothetical protein CVT24_000248 [Panaeolus cyanescens]|uniref:Transmembrane protein n=1 Tax=Panaeolus cyanescens TaxID=181874 RepID=A0A409YD78_9AGAR|nr:hypothetical protein CVT24_000248 [Panaeolus cyanescens]